MMTEEEIAKLLVDELEAGPAHARILARRIAESAAPLPPITIFRDSMTIVVDGKRSGRIAPISFALFEVLFAERGGILPLATAIRRAKVKADYPRIGGDWANRDHVRKLRASLSGLGVTIENVYRRGYRIAARREERISS